MRRKIAGIVLVLVMAFFVNFLPQNVHAEETKNTDEIQVIDKDFNKKKNIRITDEEIYSKTGKYVWLKYKSSADGYLTVTVSDISEDNSGATGYIALYNSTKAQAYSAKTIYYNTSNTKNAYWYKFVFGLQKDMTYYLRVKAETPVKLTRTYTKIKDKSGAAYTSALEVKKNKAKTGLLAAGNSTADWYKITLTKSKKIKAYYKAKTLGKFRISVYSDKNRRLAYYDVGYSTDWQKLTICQYNYSTGKKTAMPAGTYYIKIEKENTKSSGFYKFKWNY